MVRGSFLRQLCNIVCSASNFHQKGKVLARGTLARHASELLTDLQQS